MQRAQGSSAGRKARPPATAPSARFPLELPSWACWPHDVGAAPFPAPLSGAEPTWRNRPARLFTSLLSPNGEARPHHSVAVPRTWQDHLGIIQVSCRFHEETLTIPNLTFEALWRNC